MSVIKFAVPDDRLQQAGCAVGEFRDWSKALIEDANFHGPEGVMWSSDREQMFVMYTAPKGERFGTAVENKTIAETIFRVVAVRSRRRNPDGSMTPVPKGWWKMVVTAFAPLFDGCKEREVGDGWIDLTLAMADWIWQLESSVRFAEFAERDGALRIDAQGYDDKVFEILESIEWLSAHVCETCGAPGKTYNRGLVLRAVTACSDHKPADGDDE